MAEDIHETQAKVIDWLCMPPREEIDKFEWKPYSSIMRLIYLSVKKHGTPDGEQYKQRAIDTNDKAYFLGVIRKEDYRFFNELIKMVST